jgi:hypothetical protein
MVRYRHAHMADKLASPFFILYIFFVERSIQQKLALQYIYIYMEIPLYTYV